VDDKLDALNALGREAVQRGEILPRQCGQFAAPTAVGDLDREHTFFKSQYARAIGNGAAASHRPRQKRALLGWNAPQHMTKGAVQIGTCAFHGDSRLPIVSGSARRGFARGFALPC